MSTQHLARIELEQVDGGYRAHVSLRGGPAETTATWSTAGALLEHVGRRVVAQRDGDAGDRRGWGM
jgi:hypothetical protein